MNYLYKARNSEGRIIEGFMEAESEFDLGFTLAIYGCWLISCQTENEG